MTAKRKSAPGGPRLTKDDLLRFHALLYQQRLALEAEGDVGGAFDEYDATRVFPPHVASVSDAHVRAVKLLCEAISRVVVERYASRDPRLRTCLTFPHKVRPRSDPLWIEPVIVAEP